MRSAAKAEREARASAKRELEGLQAVAELRAHAIMQATEMVFEAAPRRPAWREFELEWFLRRLEEARRSLAHAPPKMRLAFVDRLRPTSRILREATGARFETGVAAGLMLEALASLFNSLEGRTGQPVQSSAEALAVAEQIRQAGGFPFFNPSTRTIDRLPKASAVGGSVWIVHQKVGHGRAYAITHGPSGMSLSVPSMPKAQIDVIARSLAEEVPDFGREVEIYHLLEGGPGNSRSFGGIQLAHLRELRPALDRAMARAGVS